MEEAALTVAGVRVHVAQIGEGPALVLIHAGGSQSAWTTWAENLTALSRQYRVIIPDLPGLGESGPPTRSIDSEDEFFRYYPRFVRSLLEIVAPEGAVLVGAGSGGGICLSVAARYPGLARALVLVDAEIIGRLIETETSLLRCQTLIIWQADDLLVPPEHARTLASRIPGAELRLLPGDHSRDEWGGNMPHRLWPSEFDATVLDFLARVTENESRA
ncbi:MAG TPA: alpha/beta hydrolase [Thermomicrobiales bacterium]|nr:alpha/beta hydrolase [Thermomicrobiales bacterium]